METPLISIIIPTYNRAHLISETLDSIIAQTYTNWECIVVDDGSTDNTSEVMAKYTAKDSRFQYHHRPKDKLSGGNAARNYGFELSRGEFVNWFDSDDLMTKYHINEKYKVITKKKVDFVIGKTQNFRGNIFETPYEYIKKPYGITLEDFVLRKIGWYTYDVLLKRTVAEKIRFNEKLFFWQDFNYFCKLLTVTTNGIYFDKIITHRRLHQNSIQEKVSSNSISFSKKMISVMDLTYDDICSKLTDYGKDEMVRSNMNMSFILARSRVLRIPLLKKTSILVEKRFGFWAKHLFLLSLLLAYVTRKGEFILKKSKRN